MKPGFRKALKAGRKGWREGFLAVAREAQGLPKAIHPRVSPIRRISLEGRRSAA